ncbi:MAG: hypothetical protein LBJ75_04580 [Puniceicoccales bacterium]|jgi:hypothetical protein|nr:hypothetical protein [Puniceicoccales bacterium]
MDKVERREPVQYWNRLAAILEKEENDAAKNDAAKTRNFIAIDGKKVNIPQRTVSEGTLVKARSVVAVADPEDSIVNRPRSWIEFTMENTAKLTEDEIVELLQLSGQFDASKLASILFLPNGPRIATQLVNRMSGDCLLKAIGRDLMAADNLVCILFPEDYFDGLTGESPTVDRMAVCVRRECEPLPQGLSKEKADGQISIVSQTMMKVCADKDRRKDYESRLQRIVDLIFNKLPPPNKENQKQWDNIYTAVMEETTDLDGETSEDGEKKLEELERRYTVWKVVEEN